MGAGAGATVGKMMGGGRAMKGGLGSAALLTSDGLIVGAIVAVNAVGIGHRPAHGETGRRRADRQMAAAWKTHSRWSGAACFNPARPARTPPSVS